MPSLSGFDIRHAAVCSAMPPCVPSTHAQLAVERQGAVAVLVVHHSAVVGRVDRPRRTLRRVLEVLRTNAAGLYNAGPYSPPKPGVGFGPYM